MDDDQTSSAKLPAGAAGAHSDGASTPESVLDLDPSGLDSALPDPDQDDALTVETDASELHGPSLLYPIVAIGASAGGLQAFRDLLEQLSPQTGMAFVFISHLAPHHDTQILDLLRRHTTMPVAPIEEGVRPMPNHIYVLMPNEVVRITGGAFRVQQRPAHNRNPATINRFFRSLAEDQKNYSIGVVLSGGRWRRGGGAKEHQG